MEEANNRRHEGRTTPKPCLRREGLPRRQADVSRTIKLLSSMSRRIGRQRQHEWREFCITKALPSPHAGPFAPQLWTVKFRQQPLTIISRKIRILSSILKHVMKRYVYNSITEKWTVSYRPTSGCYIIRGRCRENEGRSWGADIILYFLIHLF